MTKNRNDTIDIAKGLGIIFVVLGHSWISIRDMGELYRVLFSFHIPLFFYLSGIFLRPSDKPRLFILSKFHSLLKPYFVVLSILCVAKYATWPFLHTEKGLSFAQYINGAIVGTGLSLIFSQMTIVWVALWFLPHLFLSSTITWVAIRLIKSDVLIFACALISLALGVWILGKEILPWSLDLTPITFAFLAIGYLSRNVLNTLKFGPLPFFIALLIFFSLHYFFDETINLNTRHYGQFFICTAQAILGIYICLTGAAIIEKDRISRKVFSYIGSGSLFILIFHWFFMSYVFDTMRLICNPFLSSAIGILTGIAFPLIFWEISKRIRLLSLLLLPRNYLYAANRDRRINAEPTT